MIGVLCKVTHHVLTWSFCPGWQQCSLFVFGLGCLVDVTLFLLAAAWHNSVCFVTSRMGNPQAFVFVSAGYRGEGGALPFFRWTTFTFCLTGVNIAFDCWFIVTAVSRAFGLRAMNYFGYTEICNSLHSHSFLSYFMLWQCL